ncbi:MAG TPA: thioredoxin family protein [Candidatus Polarisedimenticolia bacterium]|jgi:thiol-disulfide isomerase/thioredoxin
MRLHDFFRSPGLSVLILAACAATALSAAPTCYAGEGTPSALLGNPMPDFKLSDFAGVEHTLARYHGGKGVVLIFVSTKCPVSNAYNERMIELAAEYQPKGFQFLGINANKMEDPAEMASHAKGHGWNFPVLKDSGNAYADKVAASVTPEVYLVDAAGILRYHGRIDDSQDPSGVKTRDLKAALDALITGQEIAKRESKAFGCTIKRG